MRQYTPESLIPTHCSMKDWNRFCSKIHVSENGCWEWQSTLNNKGYGEFSIRGKRIYAHRFAYESTVAKIPQGLFTDHLCRNPCCCNPAHLEPVTPRENQLRGIGFAAKNANKTHCKNGHPFDDVNTKIIFRDGIQYRDCKRCRYIRSSQSAENRKALRKIETDRIDQERAKRDALWAGLYQSGLHLAQIGKQFNVDAGTVRHALVKQGIKRRKPHNQELKGE